MSFATKLKKRFHPSIKVGSHRHLTRALVRIAGVFRLVFIHKALSFRRNASPLRICYHVRARAPGLLFTSRFSACVDSSSPQFTFCTVFLRENRGGVSLPNEKVVGYLPICAVTVA